MQNRGGAPETRHPSSREVVAQRLVLGTAPLAWLDEAVWRASLDTFLDAGGVWIDTAFAYGSGQAEAALGRQLRRIDQSAARVSTKIGHFPDAARFRDPRSLAEALQPSFDRLGSVTDNVFVHEADWGCWWSDGVAPGALLPNSELQFEDAPVLQVLAESAAAHGFCWGISGNNALQLARVAQRLRPARVLVAKQWDLLWRSADAFFNTPEPLTADLWLASPFHQGWLFHLDHLRRWARDRQPDLASAVQRLQELLERHGVAIGDIALPYVLSRRPRARIVFGVDAPNQVRAAVRALSLPMPPELMAEIDALGVHLPPMQVHDISF